MDCSSDDEEGILTGIFEGGGGYGEFSLSMSADGRRFSGGLGDDDGSELEWTGFRRQGARGEAPPRRVAWLHEALLGRGRCRLKAGDAAEALEDVRAATAASRGPQPSRNLFGAVLCTLGACSHGPLLPRCLRLATRGRRGGGVRRRGGREGGARRV